jgi:hypothetical protein
MIRAVPIRILREVLLVVVGAEAFSCTEITELSDRGHAVGRLSVDVDDDPPVDHALYAARLTIAIPAKMFTMKCDRQIRL